MRTSLITVLIVLGGCSDAEVSPIPKSPQTATRQYDLEVDLREVIGDSITFGSIDEVVLSPDRRVYVLDDMYKKIHIIDLAQGYLSAVGRRGAGPGEILTGTGISVDDQGRVYLLDHLNLRVTRFRPTDSGLEVDAEIRTPFAGMDICLVGDRVILHGLHNALRREDRTSGASILHEIDGSGEILASFGTPLTSDPITRELGTAAFIKCDSDGIIVVTKAMPVVRRFDIRGVELWRTTIPGFVELTFNVASHGHAYETELPEGYDWHHMVSGLTDLRGLVTIQLRRSPENRDGPLVESRIFDRTTGEFLGRLKLPRVAVATDSVLFGSIYDPFPKLGVFHVR